MKPIHVFARHCNFSKVSKDKSRPDYFSREICYQNLRRTNIDNLVQIHYFIDGDIKTHFIKDEKNIKVVSAGSETKSFLMLLDYILSFDFKDETIIYIVEDDYFHREGWPVILMQGFSLNIDYVTLYDHGDKYIQKFYPKLVSKIFCTQNCHWRTIPSTTNTYAMKIKTLKRDIEIHKKYSNPDELYTADHYKFLELWDNSSGVISSIPGWSTHVAEDIVLSPCIDWRELVKEESLKNPLN